MSVSVRAIVPAQCLSSWRVTVAHLRWLFALLKTMLQLLPIPLVYHYETILSHRIQTLITVAVCCANEHVCDQSQLAGWLAELIPSPSTAPDRGTHGPQWRPDSHPESAGRIIVNTICPDLSRDRIYSLQLLPHERSGHRHSLMIIVKDITRQPHDLFAWLGYIHGNILLSIESAYSVRGKCIYTHTFTT